MATNAQKRLAIFLFVLGLFLGSLFTLVWNYYRPFDTKYGNIKELQQPKRPKSLLDMFMGGNPIADMFEGLESQFENNGQGGFQFQFNLGQNQSIESSEDEKFYYFTLNLNDLKAKTFNVNIEDNQIIIQAQLESANKDENSISSVIQSFTRSLPAPPDAELDKFEVENKENKIIIKIPKKN